MMASRLVLLRLVGYVFVCSFVTVVLATPVVFHSTYTNFDTMIGFWLNNSCVFPPITTFQRDILSTDNLVLEPCNSRHQDERTETETFTGHLCEALYRVSKAFCTKAVSQSDIAQDKVNPYVEDERWDVCKDAQTTGKDILLFMTKDRALCERYCLSSATLGPVCRLLVAGVVSYVRSKGEWKASESRSEIAAQGRTETVTEKETSDTSVIQNPQSKVDLAPVDHPHGDEGPISAINLQGPRGGKTEKVAGNREEEPVGGIRLPGFRGGQTEKVSGNKEEEPISGIRLPEKVADNREEEPVREIRPPELGGGQTETVAGNREKEPISGISLPGPRAGQTLKDVDNGEEGPISKVNQPGHRADQTQEYDNKLKPEASSRVTQPVEQATVEGITEWITSVSSLKAGGALERNISEDVGSDEKYHSTETNKGAIGRGDTVRERTDNHTIASEPKNKDAMQDKDETTGSIIPPFGPAEDNDYPSIGDDDDEADPDIIDNEYEDPNAAADDENDNRNFEILSDTKKTKQQPDIPKDGVVKIPKQMDVFEEEESSGHFMAYFVTAVVLCIAGYVLYHNKQKIIAFVLEGRRDAQRRRTTSSGTAKYTKLEPSVEEVMPSLDKSAATKNFIY